MRWGCYALIVVSGLSATAVLAEPQTFELSAEGRWQHLDQTPATQPAATPVIDEAERLLEQRKSKDAIKSLSAWLKSRPDSPARDRALFVMARALFDHGNRIRAFFYLDQLMDEHPDSRYYDPALQLQYEIADAYLDGYKRRFLRMPMFGAEEEAVEMLYRIQQRAPGSALAEKALLRTADYYFASSDFDLAADAYGHYVNTYPRSAIVPKVKLRRAYSSLAQFRALRFDATPLIDAREQMVRLIDEHPELARQENVSALLARIDQSFAGKLDDTADYYLRTNQPRAAAYYWQYLLRHYPNAPEAQRARHRLEQLPDSARAGLAVSNDSPTLRPPARESEGEAASLDLPELE